MKKRILAIVLSFIIAVPLILGAVLGFAYYSVKPEEVVPLPVILVGDNEYAPSGYTWNQPVLGGIIYRSLEEKNTAFNDLGIIGEGKFDITFPAEYPTAVLTVSKDGSDIYEGNTAGWADLSFYEDGEYKITLSCAVAQKGSGPYGSFMFELHFTILLSPVIEASGSSVQQGDILVIHLRYLPEGTAVAGEANFGGEVKPLFFVKSEDRRWTAYIAIPYNQDPGEYAAKITAGDEFFEVSYTVAGYDFPRQDMEIDMNDPAISQSQSSEAYAQFNAAIIPVMLSFTEEIYWKGEFVVPAEGRISTDYGTRRYTNGSANASIHKGMDIAADEGAPIVAPNHGKVVFADFLDTSGNTLVIDYGGGLKSYFFHMSSLAVKAGDMVEKGQFVGEVGSTGYSTGPHLHYEIRVGNQTFDPARLTNNDTQLYFLMPEDDD